MQRISVTINEQLKQELDSITAKGEGINKSIKPIEIAIQDWHKQQALKKLLDFKPYKSDKNSVDVLRQIRIQRSQQHQ